MANFLKSLFVKGVEIDTSGASSGKVLSYDGTKFAPATPGSGSLALDDLSDVTITSPEQYQTVVYDGSAWINEYPTTVSLVNNAETTTLQVGEVVYLYGNVGNHASVKRADNDADSTSAKTVGVVAKAIAANATGPVVTRGYVTGMDLSTGYTAGQTLYLGENGGFTTTKPYAPEHLVYVGVVVRATNNGIIYVATQNGYELDEIHDVDLITNAPVSGDFLKYNGSLWVNDAINLGTDTVGNYMVNVSAGTGISISHTQSEGSTATISLANTNISLNGTSVSLTSAGAQTVTAAAGTLTGTTLNSTVTSSSLTSVGTLSSLTVTGSVTASTLKVDSTHFLRAVTGQYGSIEVTGDNTAYAGYGINGNAVFMSNGSSFGLYDDTNNQWFMYKDFNGASRFYYAGTERILIKHDGVSIRGDSSGTGVNGTLNAYAYYGNSNVGGTGDASYHPAGIYSTNSNWFYGTTNWGGNTQTAVGHGQPNANNTYYWGLGVFGVNAWSYVGSYNFYNPSDERYKQNIKPLTLGLNFLKLIDPIEFTYLYPQFEDENSNTPSSLDEGSRYRAGFSAQNVKQALTTLGSTDFNFWSLVDKNDDNSVQVLDYTGIIAPLVQAIKELDARLSALETNQ